MCLAQRHNAVTPMMIDQGAPWSRVKHCTTKPLCTLHENAFGRSSSSIDLKRFAVSKMAKHRLCFVGNKMAYASASTVPPAYVDHMTGDG